MSFGKEPFRVVWDDKEAVEREIEEIQNELGISERIEYFEMGAGGMTHADAPPNVHRWAVFQLRPEVAEGCDADPGQGVTAGQAYARRSLGAVDCRRARIASTASADASRQCIPPSCSRRCTSCLQRDSIGPLPTR